MKRESPTSKRSESGRSSITRSDTIPDKLEILHCGNYFTVVNKNGKYKNHAHVKKEDTAYLLAKLIKRKTVPNSNYLRQSAKRITIDKKV